MTPRKDETEAERRRRLAEVFGDVLPETTSDERDPGEDGDDRSSDEWLRRQVPPHHG
jgi:hypothetical protein